MKTLVVVGDDVALRTLLVEALTARGHTVTACADGEAAWRAVQHEVVGVILLWEYLPGMGGLELCRRMRSHPLSKDSEILLLSAEAQTAGLREALAAGATDYLLVPCDPAVLEVRLTIAEQRATMAQERARRDVALAESMAPCRTLVEQLPDVVYTAALEPPYATTSIGPRVEALMGVSPTAWLADPDPWRAHLHPDDHARVLAARQEVHATGRAVVVEYRVRTSTGVVAWVREHARVVRDQAGQPVALQGVLADITARKEAEQMACRQAAIVASSDDAIIGKTLDGRITSWNRGAERLYGYTAAEALGQPISLLVPADRAHEVAPTLERLRRGESIDDFETIRQRKDGQRIAVALTISAVRDAQGQITGTATIARDITARRGAEETLRLQALLLDAVGQAVIATDLQGSIIYWNRAAESLYGWPAAEVLGRPVLEVIPSSSAAEEGAEIMATLQRGAVWHGEFLVQRRDGSTFPAEVSTTPIHDRDGALIGIVGISTDITARHEAEEQLRTHAQAQEVLARLARLANTTLELESLLPRLCQALTAAGGVDQASVFLHAGPQTLRLAATTLAALAPPRALGLLAAHLFAAGQAARGGRALYYNQVSAALTQPEPVPDAGPAEGEGDTSVLATPLLLGEEVVGAVALSSAAPGHFAADDLARAGDMTQVIASALRNARLYQREHEVAEQLRQVERWRSGFLRVMAHEVRTPLGQISGFSDLLSSEAARLTERGQRYLTNVRTAAVRLEALVRRSFDLLQLYASEAPAEREPLEVGQLIESALAGYRAPAAAKGIVVHARSAPVSVQVEGDRQQLFQALTILLDNALKFTPAGGAIEVAVQQVAGRVEVAVCDSGPGVAAEVRASLFGGGQAEDPLTRQHGGLGMSLLMARRIIELHGGQLRLEVPDHGACFVVALPIRGDARQAARTEVSQTTLRQLVAQPSPLAVVYWGQQRLAPQEARAALATLQGHERVVLVGRFAYVEAPPPGQPERRAGETPPAPRAQRLADQLTDPAAMGALEQRLQAALEGGDLTAPASRLGAAMGLPWRTLEAVCYAWEEKGLLQVLQTAETGDEGDFVVLQVTLSAVTRAPRPLPHTVGEAEQMPRVAPRGVEP